MVGHVHEWRLIESRVLHGVEPPIKVQTSVCVCGERKEVEMPHKRK